MSKIHSNPRNPRGPLFLLVLVLGVSLFQMFDPSPAIGIEPDSPIFEKNMTGEKEKTSLPLPEERPSPTPGWFSIISRVLFALLLVAGAIILTIWGLKMVWERKGWNAVSEDGKPIKVLSNTYLAPRKAIYLVEVGKRILVIGSGGDSLSRLDVFTDPEEVEVLKQASRQGFSGIFGKVLQKHEAAVQEQETKKFFEESKKAVGGYVEKLKEISKKKGSGSRKGDEE